MNEEGTTLLHAEVTAYSGVSQDGEPDVWTFAHSELKLKNSKSENFIRHRDPEIEEQLKKGQKMELDSLHTPAGAMALANMWQRGIMTVSDAKTMLRSMVLKQNLSDAFHEWRTQWNYRRQLFSIQTGFVANFNATITRLRDAFLTWQDGKAIEFHMRRHALGWLTKAFIRWVSEHAIARIGKAEGKFPALGLNDHMITGVNNRTRLGREYYKLLSDKGQQIVKSRLNYLLYRWKRFRKGIYSIKLANLWKRAPGSTGAHGNATVTAKKKKKKKKSATPTTPKAPLPPVPEDGDLASPPPSPDSPGLSGPPDAPDESSPPTLAALGDLAEAPSDPSNPSDADDADDADEYESTIGGQTTCVVCFVGKKTHAAAPCGHQCVCTSCSAELETCPYCRRKVVCWMQVRVV